ncbi:SdiA-regulated domain-containing protein [Salinimicrobium sediminilitoris]|uniref:SdiA-regulated domain-containing protein n=1 Tax=Salinimicrobium sediminilitoris TaxID=2876715 RepID=UPI001E452846|nr:SdiA-regulated domain-containing protein [Salinimicrobium sediminilitoris]MCC8360405.1 SdiA-regulated domain-containing protein [Salinimicrobium sediminilitoris]
MKKVIFGILILIGGVLTISACKGKASELQHETFRYEILEKWELPKALNEVSGIAWIGDNRIACVQDEDGIIFLYNLKDSKIEEEIEFGNGGDYEGIAVVEKDAYVLRSDGIILEVSDYLGKDPQVQRHVTNISQLPGINIEGLCADPANDRLLLAVKERKNCDEYKEVFAFNLNKKASDENAFFSIDLSDPIFKNVDEKFSEKFTPGEMNIHPITGEFFILDGTRPKLLITENDGRPKELFMLKLKDFGNPEGLTFNPEGELYISNEAEDGPASILKVSLNRN